MGKILGIISKRTKDRYNQDLLANDVLSIESPSAYGFMAADIGTISFDLFQSTPTTVVGEFGYFGRMNKK